MNESETREHIEADKALDTTTKRRLVDRSPSSPAHLSILKCISSSLQNTFNKRIYDAEFWAAKD